MDEQYNNYADARLGGHFGEMSSWRLVRPFLHGKRVLDVGCSDGLYLRYFSPSSQGIEQVPALAEMARRRGLNVLQGDVFDSIKLIADGQFEGVFFSHVMEHVDSPIQMLREINRVLVKGGVLVIGLPIERNIYRDLLRMDYFNGTHIYSFSVRNAKKLLNETGFAAGEVFFHLPRCRSRVGGMVERAWNAISLPFKAYLSMAYWIVAIKM